MQIASAVTQPVASVQPPFDLHRSSTKPCTNFFPQYPPAISVPAYRVVLSHSAGHPYTQDFFQVLFAPQSSMGIAWISRCHRKTLLPLGKKAHLQEMICSLDAVDSRQPHLLHQTILKSFKQPLDTPFRLRTVGRDPFNPQFVQGSPELRSQRDLPAVVREAAAGRPFERCCFYRCNGPRDVRSAVPIRQTFAGSLRWCRAR